jgi:hypothetical protein
MSLSTLKNVIECLRETGRYVDEEGEATNALDDLAQSLEPLTEAQIVENCGAIDLGDPDWVTQVVRAVERAHGIGVSAKPGQTFPPSDADVVVAVKGGEK